MKEGTYKLFSRALCLILAVLMAGALLAGCSQPAAQSKPASRPEKEEDRETVQETTQETVPETAPPETLSPEDYHTLMASVLDSEEPVEITDYKAVTFYFDEKEDSAGTYCTRYLPEAFVADSPEQVHYLVSCTLGADQVGVYQGVGSNRMGAFQRWLKVEIIDTVTGQTMSSETFQGAPPPQTITQGQSPYGDYPDNDEIAGWIQTVLQDAYDNRYEAVMQKAAERLNGINGLSHKGLIERLVEYDGFPLHEATYAADNCGADWNEQVLKAIDYDLFRPGTIYTFSYKSLVIHLQQNEGFTREQAVYGADNCGADWNEQAAKCAADYLEVGSFTRDSMISQLLFEGFTEEQAIYGADAVKLK